MRSKEHNRTGEKEQPRPLLSTMTTGMERMCKGKPRLLRIVGFPADLYFKRQCLERSRRDPWTLGRISRLCGRPFNPLSEFVGAGGE